MRSANGNSSKHGFSEIYDLFVAGGGFGGAALTSRPSEDSEGSLLLLEAERRSRHEAETLRDAATAFVSSLELHDVLEAILVHLERLAPADGAYIMLREADGLRIVASRGWDEVVGCRSEVAATAVLEEIQENARALVSADVRRDARLGRGRHPDVRSSMDLPLIAHGKIIGLLGLESCALGAFDEAKELSAKALANQAAMAIENARLFHEVKAKREELRLLTQRVVSVHEREREVLSRELHDEAGQALIALKISLDLLETDVPHELEGIRERIREAADLTDRTVEHIRTLSHDLRPPELDAVGLDSALRGFCREFSKRTRLRIDYAGTAPPPLPSGAAITLFRVLQEALTNVAKYAEAHEVRVELGHDSGESYLLVEDDGQGFDAQASFGPAGRPKGIGLLGMRERLEFVGGRLAIDSRRGKGTRLLARVPSGPAEAFR